MLPVLTPTRVAIFLSIAMSMRRCVTTPSKTTCVTPGVSFFSVSARSRTATLSPTRSKASLSMTACSLPLSSSRIARYLPSRSPLGRAGSAGSAISAAAGSSTGSLAALLAGATLFTGRLALALLARHALLAGLAAVLARAALVAALAAVAPLAALLAAAVVAALLAVLAGRALLAALLARLLAALGLHHGRHVD